MRGMYGVRSTCRTLFWICACSKATAATASATADDDSTAPTMFARGMRKMLHTAGVRIEKRTASKPSAATPLAPKHRNKLDLQWSPSGKGKRSGKRSGKHQRTSGQENTVRGSLVGSPTWTTTSSGLRVITVFNISDTPVFNLAFRYQGGAWQAAGRYWNHETFRMRGCGDIAHGRHKHTNNAGMMSFVAFMKNVSTGDVTPMWPPAAVRCEAIGEPKFASAFHNTLIIYTHWKCPEELYKSWREYWAPFGRQVVNNFVNNQMRNYLVHLSDPKKATLLSYRQRPEERSAAKNFNFFRVEKQVFVETLFNPHKVYALDAQTGLMNLSWVSTFANRETRHPTDTTVGLSAGPVRLNATTFLAAAHVSRGGWADAYRMTFFYLFDARPPFGIRCATPPMSFGYSETLEYCTSLQLIRKHLFVGFGYKNCFSALLEVSAADITARCVPSDEIV